MIILYIYSSRILNVEVLKYFYIDILELQVKTLILPLNVIILTLQPHSELNLFISLEFLDSKGINNQWMGVRVRSQGPGKSVMVSQNSPHIKIYIFSKSFNSNFIILLL